MTKGDTLKKSVVWGLLFLMIAYHFATNLWFISADRRPANINELSHVISGIDFLDLLIDQESKYSAFLQAFHGYPPAGAVATVFYAVFGRVHDSAQISQLLFSLMLIFGLFGLARRLFDDATALFAVFLCLTAPASCEVSRQYLLEWSLTATSTAAAFFLLASRGFSIRRNAMAAGLFVGLAALCKQTFLIFLAGPLFFAVYEWVVHLKNGTRSTARPPAKLKSILGVCGSFIFAGAFSWLLYSKINRSAIDNWLNASNGGHTPWGMIFLVLTFLILGISLALLFLRETTFRNAISAGLFSIFVASLWYFPKGLSNYLTYKDQFDKNVTEAAMSPATLLNFYQEHLRTYYLGPVLQWLLLVALAGWVVLFLLRPLLGRYFYMKETFPPLRSMIFVGLWLLIPAVGFFFISIQNEMNTVPVLPSMMLLAAALFMWLRLRLTKKAKGLLAAGKALVGARLAQGVVAVFAGALILAAIVNGLALSYLFRTEKSYTALPVMKEVNVRKIMPRKFNTLNYLVPRPASWHEWEITRAMIESAGGTSPKVLIMDVDFYYSWNLFWYMFKLAHFSGEVQTQWYSDRDLLAGQNGELPLFQFDQILYRQPWKKLYAEAYSDYMEYENLWKTYAYIADGSEEFKARYSDGPTWTLPDDSIVYMKIKKPNSGPVEQGQSGGANDPK